MSEKVHLVVNLIVKFDCLFEFHKTQLPRKTNSDDTNLRNKTVAVTDCIMTVILLGSVNVFSLFYIRLIFFLSCAVVLPQLMFNVTN